MAEPIEGLTITVGDKPVHQGQVTSYCPDFAMIPLSALTCLAQRYELGEKKYGRDSWRANVEKHGIPYLVERLNHVIFHAKKLQDKLEGRIPWDPDDDCGGMLWGAATAVEGMKMLGVDSHIDPKAEV